MWTVIGMFLVYSGFVVQREWTFGKGSKIAYALLAVGVALIVFEGYWRLHEIAKL